jgi:hypothetical protein
MVHQMIELHPHEKFLEPGQHPVCSVIAFHDDVHSPEEFAKHLQISTLISAERAWQLTSELQDKGSAKIFTGHPQDCELVVVGLHSHGIRTELQAPDVSV